MRKANRFAVVDSSSAYSTASTKAAPWMIVLMRPIAAKVRNWARRIKKSNNTYSITSRIMYVGRPLASV